MPGGHELVFTRLIDAPRNTLFRCWTEPRLLKQWFAPAPYRASVAEVDLRVGGANRIVMTGPGGRLAIFRDQIDHFPNGAILADITPCTQNSTDFPRCRSG